MSCSNVEQPVTQVMPDDHSKLVPLLPIPNRTVKRLCADDSADSRVKVGHRQALTALNKPSRSLNPIDWAFSLGKHVAEYYYFKYSRYTRRLFSPRQQLLTPRTTGLSIDSSEYLQKIAL